MPGLLSTTRFAGVVVFLFEAVFLALESSHTEVPLNSSSVPTLAPATAAQEIPCAPAVQGWPVVPLRSCDSERSSRIYGAKERPKRQDQQGQQRWWQASGTTEQLSQVCATAVGHDGLAGTCRQSSAGHSVQRSRHGEQPHHRPGGQLRCIADCQSYQETGGEPQGQEGIGRRGVGMVQCHSGALAAACGGGRTSRATARSGHNGGTSPAFGAVLGSPLHCDGGITTAGQGWPRTGTAFYLHGADQPSGTCTTQCCCFKTGFPSRTCDGTLCGHTTDRHAWDIFYMAASIGSPSRHHAQPLVQESAIAHAGGGGETWEEPTHGSTACPSSQPPVHARIGTACPAGEFGTIIDDGRDGAFPMDFPCLWTYAYEAPAGVGFCGQHSHCRRCQDQWFRRSSVRANVFPGRRDTWGGHGPGRRLDGVGESMEGSLERGDAVPIRPIRSTTTLRSDPSLRSFHPTEALDDANRVQHEATATMDLLMKEHPVISGPMLASIVEDVLRTYHAIRDCPAACSTCPMVLIFLGHVLTAHVPDIHSFAPQALEELLYPDLVVNTHADRADRLGHTTMATPPQSILQACACPFTAT